VPHLGENTLPWLRGAASLPASGNEGLIWPSVSKRPMQIEPLRYDAPMFGLDTVVVLLIVLAVVLVWRGPKMLPKWGETLGRGVKAARKEAEDLRKDPHGGDGTPPA